MPDSQLGPVLHQRGARILTGTCSWADKSLTANADWYPKKTMTAEERLRFYARSFPLVEADSTYYRPPGRELTKSWAERSPDGFCFDIKAYGLLTGHPVRPETLWPDIQEAIKPEFAGKERTYAHHLDPDALVEVWYRFADALEPLAERGRLGAVLMQYPTWFTPKRANRDELARLVERLPGRRISVELRSPRWLAEAERERTVGLLHELGLTFVCVDAPSTSGLARDAIVTTPALSVVRFHGRADATWKAGATSAAERFRYLYDGEELAEWVPKVRRLADRSEEVHILMNNCYQDYGIRNAFDMIRLLDGDDG